MTQKSFLNLIEKELEIRLMPSSSGSLSRGYKLDGKDNIISINLSGTKINNLRKIIKHLSAVDTLHELYLRETGIDDISGLESLSFIKYLDLSNNQIKKIDAIGRVNQLRCLAVENNYIQDLTPLLNLDELIFLSFRNNNVSEISEELLRKVFSKQNDYILPDVVFIKSILVRRQEYELASRMRNYEAGLLNLKIINSNDLIDLQENLIPYSMKGNPLTIPPYDIISQGSNAIKSYFKQINKEDGKRRFLYESKLIIIGEGGTGKTTFARKLRDAQAKMPEDTETTFGIDVVNWNYTTDFVKDGNKISANFHVNVWDFGGQTLYQGTHQMFFSNKSFYVLMGDTREEKLNFSYWLNTVEQLAGTESALMIVLNQKYGHQHKFDEKGYLSHFGSLIKEVIQLDLKNDIDKISSLQEKIKVVLKYLPGMGDELPASWVAIRARLSKENESFISFDKFKDICYQHSISDHGMIQTISGYLTRIGAITHYIDDPLLMERVFLDSNWLVKTVYQVLDNEIVKSKNGRIQETEVKEIWDKNQLRFEVPKLTYLMHKFGLMYNILQTDKYVIPAHLPSEMPYSKWSHDNKIGIITFIYEFDKYMPQGIMSRLIVSLHNFIKNHSFVWQRGFNLEKNETYSEIVESYGGTNRFEIRICGTEKIELLAIIRDKFASILQPYSNLKYKQLLPCTCTECNEKSEPAYHEFNLLLKFREKGVGSQCSKTGNIVNVEELLKITEYKPFEKKHEDQTRNSMKTIKIFLASSSELESDRKDIREFISVENDRLHEQGIYLKLYQWEYFIDAMSATRLQDEYNKAVKGCDIFLSLFFSKVGKFTAEEFESAFGQFQMSGRPFIYTYFKNSTVRYEDINEEDFKSRKVFEEKLNSLGHFKTTYTTIADFKVHFKNQLDEILPILQV